jgi:hypothetical protein
MPGQDDSWTYDDKQTAFDKTRGVVKYVVNLKEADVSITFSQQVMPTQLKPVGSDSWKAFISQEKPMTDQAVGDGTVYYLPALANGVPPASGSDTIIYATDKILMFGKAGRVMDAATWVRLLGSMSKK